MNNPDLLPYALLTVARQMGCTIVTLPNHPACLIVVEGPHAQIINEEVTPCNGSASTPRPSEIPNSAV